MRLPGRKGGGLSLCILIGVTVSVSLYSNVILTITPSSLFSDISLFLYASITLSCSTIFALSLSASLLNCSLSLLLPLLSQLYLSNLDRSHSIPLVSLRCLPGILFGMSQVPTKEPHGEDRSRGTPGSRWPRSVALMRVKPV